MYYKQGDQDNLAQNLSKLAVSYKLKKYPDLF